MSASLAAKIRGQFSELRAMFKAFGAVESIFFRGVGPGGYDIYGVKFANGVAEIRFLLGGGWQGRGCHLPAGWQRSPRRGHRLFGRAGVASQERDRADQGADLQRQRQRDSTLQAGRGGKTRGPRARSARKCRSRS